MQNMVNQLLKEDNIVKAIEIITTNSSGKEIQKPLTKLVNKLVHLNAKDFNHLIHRNHFKNVLKIINSIEKSEDRDPLYQRIASGLAMHGGAEEVLDVVDRIRDADVRGLSLSVLVYRLVSRGEYGDAMIVAKLIQENDFREDAHRYILGGLLKSSTLGSVMRFVDGIENTNERNHAVKALISFLRSTHDNSKLEQVSKHFISN